MFYVNQYGYQHRRGELNLPTRSANVYASPANPYIGAQILPPQSTPSKLTLSRYDVRLNLAVNRNLQLATIGQIVSITDEHGIRYHHVPYRLNWFVADVRVVTEDIIASFDGYEGSVRVEYKPASRLITEWTIYPIPVV